jgi:transposase InsO family protein
MCSTLEVSRSGYYAWLVREESAHAREDRRLQILILEEHEKGRETYGAVRIHAALKKRGETCGLHRVERLRQEAGIRSKTSRKFKKTTDSDHAHWIAPNLLEQDFTAEAPNRAWVSDITYIWTEEGWLFLAATLDLYSRKIVGWAMSAFMPAELVGDALQMALDQRSPEGGLVHHSDRGVQYAAHLFQGVLEQNGITCSMSGKGNCYDNAAMESFFHTLKTELCDHQHYRTRAEARASVFEYIEVFYNRTRLHSTLGYCSPIEFEAQRIAV